jgi:uncharacterized damage-inducible protein DinB
MMTRTHDQPLLEAVLDSWDRNNTILINLLRVVPEGGLDARAMSDGHTVGALFTHMHYVRLAFIEEDAPEFAKPLPEEWVDEGDPARIERMLNESAQAVRDAVKARLDAERQLDLHYDHPILFLQHMIWHEGYHHGQIKLALKASGRPIADQVAGRGTWGIWMRKTT